MKTDQEKKSFFIYLFFCSEKHMLDKNSPRNKAE